MLTEISDSARRIHRRLLAAFRGSRLMQVAGLHSDRADRAQQRLGMRKEHRKRGGLKRLGVRNDNHYQSHLFFS
jgi:hypothetical protein